MLSQRLSDDGTLVRPASNAEAAGPEAVAVQEWADIYDVIYEPTDDTGTGPDYAGWRSSITGENYTDAEMGEWADLTVAEILALSPKRVLEVGCGSGILARQLIPHLDRYVGADISSVVIKRLNDAYIDNPNVEFLVRAADAVDGLTGFDVVVINSVVQHFPSEGYLAQSLELALAACGPDGSVFIGDVRSMPEDDAFHLYVLAGMQPGPMAAGDVLRFVRNRATADRQLVIHPDFFHDFARAQSGQGRRIVADLRNKPGRHPTEMNQFRFDVRLRSGDNTGALVRPDAVNCVAWHERIPSIVDTLTPPVVVTGVPYPVTSQLIWVLGQLVAADPEQTVDINAMLDAAIVANPGITPDELRELAGPHVSCYCTPSPNRPGYFDAVFATAEQTGLSLEGSGRTGPLTTRPNVAAQEAALTGTLRAYLHGRIQR